MGIKSAHFTNTVKHLLPFFIGSLFTSLKPRTGHGLIISSLLNNLQTGQLKPEILVCQVNTKASCFLVVIKNRTYYILQYTTIPNSFQPMKNKYELFII